GLLLRESGERDLAPAQPRDRRPDDAGEAQRPAGRVDARDASLLVGVRSELDVDGPVEDAVMALDAVAGRPHAVGALAALARVDPTASAPGLSGGTARAPVARTRRSKGSTAPPSRVSSRRSRSRPTTSVPVRTSMPLRRCSSGERATSDSMSSTTPPR